MAVALVSPIAENKNELRLNKCAVKLLGLESSELTDEEVLECISLYIEPCKIEALIFDSFNNFYVLFLVDIESTCCLIGKRVEFRSHCINIYPLLDCYVIQNVYPCVTNEVLVGIFRTFGNVFNVSNHHAVPNSSKFSHVLSGKREISFLLPSKELEIYIPTNVVQPPYTFHVKKFCCACLTEGHSILYCPDIETDGTLTAIKFDDEEGEDELDALIKHEMFEDDKIEESLPDTQPVVENSNGITVLSQDQPQCTNVKDGKGHEKKENGVIESTSEEQSKRLKTTAGDGLTQRSTSVSEAAELPTRRIIKGPASILTPSAKKLINECCGSYTMEAHVLKQLMITDGRLKAEVVKFAFRHLEELTDLLNLIKKVSKQCSKNEKYKALNGPFREKLCLIRNILSKHCKA